MMNSNNQIAISDPKIRKQVTDNLNEFKNDILDDVANNTRIAYLSDFEQYMSFCRDKHLAVMSDDRCFSR